MQLNNDINLSQVSLKTGFAIFELPETDYSQILTKAMHFKPNEKGIYAKDDIDNISELVHGKQNDDLIIVLEDADKMNEPAANTFLKTLEEPNDHVHFVFLVRNSRKILPTIKSRAHNYYMPQNTKTNDEPQIDKKIMDIAKSYITCKEKDLPDFCDKHFKGKEDARDKALIVLNAAIQTLYKTYFITGDKKWLAKLDKLLKAYDAINAKGHIKLQMMAGML